MGRTTPDERTLRGALRRCRKSELLDYVCAAYGYLTERQRARVFLDLFGRSGKTPRPMKCDPRRLVREVAKFRRDSFAGKYYSSFMIDSKNFMQIPAETSLWCDRFARLTKQACELTREGEHRAAVRCFSALYELLEAMESGDSKIVFAHELGGWLIPDDEKVWLKAYLRSLAATAEPQEFAKTVAPILWRDSIQSFAASAYESAIQVATPTQRVALESERARRGIRIEPAGWTERRRERSRDR